MADYSSLIELYRPDLYPKSESSSTSKSTSTSYSGLGDDASNTILGATLPGLTETAGNLSTLPQTYSDAALNQYKTQSRDDIEAAIPAVLESMNSKGMVNSSVASDTLSNTLSEIVKSYSEKGYDSVMDSAEMAMEIPEILSGIASLASQSVGETESESESNYLSEDQLAPLESFQNFLLNY